MNTELDILNIVCKKLEQAHVPYMLTGSMAANFYAVPRMTRDIDIVIEIKESDVKTLFHSFQNDFYIDEDSIVEAIKHHGIFKSVK